MARFIFLALLVVCLFYMYQASPMPQEEATTEAAGESFGDTVKNAFNSAKESIQKEYEEIMNNPKVQEMVKSTKDFFEDVHQEVQKLGK